MSKNKALISARKKLRLEWVWKGWILQKINWTREVLPHIQEILSAYEDRGMKLTLRGMFYALVSKQIIPNVQGYYKQLSNFTARARERNVLPIDCFADRSRNLANEPIEHRTVKDYVLLMIDSLEKGDELYPNTFLSKWLYQPNYVEVWVEKDALVGTFESILQDLDVLIVPNKGFSSVTFMWDNVRRLKEKQGLFENINVLYFGDLDPSGDAIDEIIKNKWDMYGLTDVNFQRIAINEEQITEFSLPSNPDPETRAKLERDTRSRRFQEKYGELFQVEVDALQAIAPDEFKSIVRNSVLDLYNEKIWDDVYESHGPEVVKAEVKKQLKGLMKRMNQN